MNLFIRAFGLSPGGNLLAPTSSSSSMSQMKSEPLPRDDLPSEIRMQNTTELPLRQDRRGKNHIPLEVHYENLLALFDSVVTSAITASAKSHESSDQVIARSLDDSLFALRIWLENIKHVMPDAESSRNSLRILGKLEGPLATIFLKILRGLETDLTGLSAHTADNNLYGQVVIYGTSSLGSTNSSGTGYSVSNFAQHVAESKHQSIDCMGSKMHWLRRSRPGKVIFAIS